MTKTRERLLEKYQKAKENFRKAEKAGWLDVHYDELRGAQIRAAISLADSVLAESRKAMVRGRKTGAGRAIQAHN